MKKVICSVLGLFLLPLSLLGYAIVLPEKPAPWEETMREELAGYLKQTVTSFRLAGEDLTAVHIGDTSLARQNGLFVEKLPREKWVIRSIGNQLILTGGGSSGVVFAVYKFLEEVIGCRFFFAGKDYLPPAGVFDFPKLDLTGQPYFAFRELHLGGEHSERLKANDSAHDNNVERAERMLAKRFLTSKSGKYGCGNYEFLNFHSFLLDVLPPDKYFEAHPEWYSIENGKRSRRLLCLSNLEMRQAFLERLYELTEKHLALAVKNGWDRPSFIQVIQEDSNNTCRCEKCTAFISQHGGSGLLLDFINSQATEYGKKYPDIRFSTLAYTWSEQPPKTEIKAAPNVIIGVTSLTGFNMLTGQSEYHDQLHLNWSRHASATGGFIWSIFFNAYPEFPWAGEYAIPAMVRRVADGNGVMFGSEIEACYGGDMFDLKTFLLTKYMEDPYREDFTVLVQDVCEKLYGSAVTDIMEFRRRIKALAEKDGAILTSMTSGRGGFVEIDDMVALQELFDEAEQKVTGNQQQLAEVRRARLGLDWLLGFERFRDYQGQWARKHPGLAFPLDILSVRRRVGQTFPQLHAPRNNSPMLIRRFARFKYLSDKQILNIPQSKEFAGEKYADLASFELKCGNFVEDPEAETGGAAFETNVRPGFGLYQEIKGHPQYGKLFEAFDVKQIQGTGYHWYKVLEGTIGNKGYDQSIIISSSWGMRAMLDKLENMDYTKPVSIYVRMKVDGPSYPFGNKDMQDSLWVDRVVLINSFNAGH